MAMQGRIPLPVLLLLLPCLLVTVAAADADDELGAIRGLVTDGQTREPLAGGVVLVHDTDYGTNTSHDGSYVIQCPPGLYVLEASFLGHRSESAEVAVLPGDTAYKDFVLYPDDGWTTQADLEYNPPIHRELVNLVRPPRSQYPPRKPNDAWREPDTVRTYRATFFRRPEPQDDTGLAYKTNAYDRPWHWVAVAENHPFFEKYFPDMRFGLLCWPGPIGLPPSGIPSATVEARSRVAELADRGRGAWAEVVWGAGGSFDTTAMSVNARATLLAAGFAWQAARGVHGQSIFDQTLDEALFHDSIPAFPAVEFVSAEHGESKDRECDLWTDGVWMTFRVENRERRVFIPFWYEDENTAVPDRPDIQWMQHVAQEAEPSQE
jgi:hypothetical protein